MEIVGDFSQPNKDDLAKLLIQKLEELDLPDSIVYYNFPFYRGDTSD